MIFQLSDWFPKPTIWAMLLKFDQIRKNWWRISCAEILEVGKNFFLASSGGKENVTIRGGSPEEIKRIASKFTKTVILLGLAGYELIVTNSAYGLDGYIYISSYPARPRRITNNYYSTFIHCTNFDFLIGWFVPRDPGLWRNNLLDVIIGV